MHVIAGQLSFDDLWCQTELGLDRRQNSTLICGSPPPTFPPVNENRDLMEMERLAYQHRPTWELEQVETAISFHLPSATPQEKARLFIVRLLMTERVEEERQHRSREVLDRWQGRGSS